MKTRGLRRKMNTNAQHIMRSKAITIDHLKHTSLEKQLACSSNLLAQQAT